MQPAAQRLHRLAFLNLAIVLIVVDLLGLEISGIAQLGALAFGVALLGIPHGAIDPLLARVFGIAVTIRQTVFFFVTYTLVAALVVGLWLLVPAFFLGVFLALSIWHFRGDWSGELKVFEASAAAATVVCGPALFHPDAITEIFAMLTFDATIEPLVVAARVSAVIAIIALICTAFLRIRQQRLVVMEVLSLPLLAWALPPLLFFVVYFCGLHSPRHMIESARVLSWRSPTVRRTVVAVSIVTVVAALGIYASLPAVDATPRLLAVVFIGLAALTVPHMLLLELTASRHVPLTDHCGENFETGP